MEDMTKAMIREKITEKGFNEDVPKDVSKDVSKELVVNDEVVKDDVSEEFEDAAAKWDKKCWNYNDIKQVTFYDVGLKKYTSTEFPQNLPMRTLFARYCFKMGVKVSQVHFSMWSETIFPDDTWQTLHAKHNIDIKDVVDVKRSQ
ncbi:unnamed protein product [Polarella glacialis]|uniref:Uncharacterized protein n=1 Tax=Polarella glacialis TaxID=89957 RepID=A0A813K1X0_POLGL|nr:unnamed protein product [Polarella glacialis]